MVDDRSPHAKAMALVSQITAIAMMAVAPALVGYGLDIWWKINPVCTLLGGVFGFGAAGYQLTQLVSRLNAEGNSSSGD